MGREPLTTAHVQYFIERIQYGMTLCANEENSPQAQLILEVEPVGFLLAAFEILYRALETDEEQLIIDYLDHFRLLELTGFDGPE